MKKTSAIKKITIGVKISTNKTRNKREIVTSLSTSSANILPALSLVNLFCIAWYAAALKVPSANKRLKVLGNLNTTKKTSARIDAPRNIAIKMF